jgi:hypothetical protein
VRILNLIKNIVYENISENYNIFKKETNYWHINLVFPIIHKWYLKNIPGYLAIMNNKIFVLKFHLKLKFYQS